MMGTAAKKAPLQLPETLPEYLGLGLLDPESVELGHNEMSANYTIEGDLLYRISISDQHFRIEEFIDGTRLIATTDTVSLQETFFRHLLKQPPYFSRRYERLYHRLQDGRNVMVRFATVSPNFYFPAGYLFTLRLPLVSGNQAAFDQVAASADGGPGKTGLRLDCVREGVVLRLLQKGEVTAEEVRIADFSAALHRVTDAVDRLWKSGIVPAEREYQLAVLDSSVATVGNLSAYLGDAARGIAAYAVVVTEGTLWTPQQLQNDFGAGACELLGYVTR